MKLLKKNFIFLSFLFITLNAKDLEKVSLQLQWLDQFQFAGYYVAKEKGYYKDAGLEVELKPFSHNINILNEVLSNKANYGVGRSSLIQKIATGKKVKFLSAIFQSSPSILLAIKNNNLQTVKDFENKKIMVTSDVMSAVSYLAMIRRESIDIKSMIKLEHSFDINDLINNKTDLMASYISNEPFLLKEKGIEYTIFDPKDYGFDFYSDILFTSQAEINQHKQRTESFKNASLKGWHYAFNNIDETVEIILNKYNSQNKSKEALIYEAKELKKLAYYKTEELGKIDLHKIQRMYDIYNVMGLFNNQNKINLDNYVFKTIDNNSICSVEEKQYLQKKKIIKICVIPDTMPYSKIENDKYIGMGADYLNLVSKIINTPFELVKTSTWSESLQNIKDRKCDVLPVAVEIPSRKEYLNFTNKIFSTPLIIATRNNEIYISDIKSILHKKIAVAKGRSYKKILELKYPDLIIVEVKNNKDGLVKVSNGEVYALVGDLASISYEIQRNSSNNIKISGNIGNDIESGMGVRSDDKILLNILNKAINNISETQKQKIYNNWINVKYETKTDYTFIFKLSIIFLIILSIVLFFLKKQKKLNNKLLELQESLKTSNTMLESRVESKVSELKKTTDMFKGIFETVKDSIALLDLESNFLLVNKAHSDMTGFTKEELYKTSCVALTKTELRENSKSILKILVDQGYISAYEKQCVVKDGRVIDVLIDLVLMPDEQSILMVSRDITGENRYKKEKKQSDERLIHQSRLAQMGEMISMIAHQWRQPLSAISSVAIDMKMQIELETFNLSKEEDKKLMFAYFLKSIDNIDTYLKNLTHTIDDFRNFYKPNKESIQSSLEVPLNISLKIIKQSLLNQNIEFDESLSSAKEIEMYSNELVQVFLNIIKNSEDNFIEKNIKNPKLSLILRDTYRGNIIEISDNGGGISKEILDKIFNPYFSTKNEKNGTGLGLYMSKMIIEEHHHGKLSVKNIKDGVCFSIELNNFINEREN